jgi:hypothetical protein
VSQLLSDKNCTIAMSKNEAKQMLIQELKKIEVKQTLLKKRDQSKANSTHSTL